MTTPKLAIAEPRPGRVYIGAERQDGGPHEGYKGMIRVSLVGVHLDGSVEFIGGDDDPGSWERLDMFDVEEILVPLAQGGQHRMGRDVAARMGSERRYMSTPNVASTDTQTHAKEANTPTLVCSNCGEPVTDRDFDLLPGDLTVCEGREAILVRPEEEGAGSPVGGPGSAGGWTVTDGRTRVTPRGAPAEVHVLSPEALRRLTAASTSVAA